VTVRVLVADDNELLRAGLVTVLSSDPDVTVVGEVSDGRAALLATARQRPDVVLMDVEMPGGDGIEATRSIRAGHPDTAVLVLTMFDLDEYVVGALHAGAAGFVLKTTEPAELLRAVHACARGSNAFGPTVMDRLVTSFVGQQPARSTAPEIAQLTDRELDVLRSMAKGLSNAEIAAELYLAETTVKTHVARILAKLGVRDRLQAVVLAHRSGVVVP